MILSANGGKQAESFTMKKAATYLQHYILLCMIYYNGNCHQNARQDLKKRFGADAVIAI